VASSADVATAVRTQQEKWKTVARTTRLYPCDEENEDGPAGYLLGWRERFWEPKLPLFVATQWENSGAMKKLEKVLKPYWRLDFYYFPLILV
jgi:hypothetical protein